MPIYDYSCSACGHSLETHQSMKDAPLTACPACGRPALKRLAARGVGSAFCGRGLFHAGRAEPTAGSGGSSAAGQPPSAPMH